MESLECLVAHPKVSFKQHHSQLLKPHQILHPTNPVPKPRPVRRLLQLPGQRGIMVRLALGMHQRLRKRVMLLEAVVQEQVRGIDLFLLVPGARGCGLDAVLEQALEVALCWAKTVGGPAREEAGVVF